MLARTDERFWGRFPERQPPQFTFWESLLARAIPTGLCLWAAWGVGTADFGNEPWAVEFQVGVTAGLVVVAITAIAVGIAQYRNGTFQD